MTMGTGVKITASLTAQRERQIVAARFAVNSQIGAGPPPFRPVRRNSAATGPKLRKQVRQFMAQGPVNFSFAMNAETTVEQNAAGPAFRAAGSAAQTSRPFHPNLSGQSGRALLEEEDTGRGFERRIAPRRLFNNGRGEGKLELAKRKHGAPGLA
jgi:hypothetical protein